MGFDCSGYMRAIFASFGISLGRDSKDQIRNGRRVDRQQVRPGDLLFFDRHVGLALSKERLIHASMGGGGVRINAISDRLRDYREDLDRNFVMARRII